MTTIIFSTLDSLCDWWLVIIGLSDCKLSNWWSNWYIDMEDKRVSTVKAVSPIYIIDSDPRSSKKSVSLHSGSSCNIFYLFITWKWYSASYWRLSYNLCSTLKGLIFAGIKFRGKNRREIREILSPRKFWTKNFPEKAKKISPNSREFKRKYSKYQWNPRN